MPVGCSRKVHRALVWQERQGRDRAVRVPQPSAHRAAIVGERGAEDAAMVGQAAPVCACIGHDHPRRDAHGAPAMVAGDGRGQAAIPVDLRDEATRLDDLRLELDHEERSARPVPAHDVDRAASPQIENDTSGTTSHPARSAIRRDTASCRASWPAPMTRSRPAPSHRTAISTDTSTTRATARTAGRATRSRRPRSIRATVHRLTPASRATSLWRRPRRTRTARNARPTSWSFIS